MTRLADIRCLYHLETIEKAVVFHLQVMPLDRQVASFVDGTKARLSFPENNTFTLEGVKFLMTHIGGPAGKYTPRVRELLNQERPDVFICGHSHILKVMQDKKYNHLHMNPGAAGVQGFHKIKNAYLYCFLICFARIFVYFL